MRWEDLARLAAEVEAEAEEEVARLLAEVEAEAVLELELVRQASETEAKETGADQELGTGGKATTEAEGKEEEKDKMAAKVREQEERNAVAADSDGNAKEPEDAGTKALEEAEHAGTAEAIADSEDALRTAEAAAEAHRQAARRTAEVEAKARAEAAELAAKAKAKLEQEEAEQEVYSQLSARAVARARKQAERIKAKELLGREADEDTGALPGSEPPAAAADDAKEKLAGQKGEDGAAAATGPSLSGTPVGTDEKTRQEPQAGKEAREMLDLAGDDAPGAAVPHSASSPKISSPAASPLSSSASGAVDASSDAAAHITKDFT